MRNALDREKLLNWLIIQGGMGAGVSDYVLAREFSIAGKGKVLGVVSGVALNEIMVRRLQSGDPTGKIRYALSKFPDQEIAQGIIDKYFIEGGKSPEQRYHSSPFPIFNQGDNRVLSLNKNLEELIVAANFVEVFLAKEGHDNPIGINYLYKIQWPFLPSVYGAMLAGVDATLIGAGFPKEFSKVLDGFCTGESALIQIPVAGTEEDYFIRFDPENIFKNCPELSRPFFIGVEGNHICAKGVPDADAYVFEEKEGGGHSMPCRSGKLTARGEPKYGEKDAMDLDKLKRILDKNEEINRYRQPFWRAGGYAGKLKLAQEEGAVGVQIGSLAALSRHSGIYPELRNRVLDAILDETLDIIDENGKLVHTVIFKDPLVSASGFPFNVTQVKGTLSERQLYDSRIRKRCDLGYLAEPYLDNGTVRLRCPGEKIEDYVNKKGGNVENTYGRGCLCNSLLTNLGYNSPNELALVTLGSDIDSIRAIVKRHGRDYGADECIDFARNPY